MGSELGLPQRNLLARTCGNASPQGEAKAEERFVGQTLEELARLLFRNKKLWQFEMRMQNLPSKLSNYQTHMSMAVPFHTM